MESINPSGFATSPYKGRQKRFIFLFSMYNLYQSKLRRDIQQEIYRKPTFTVTLFGKQYFGTIKTKKFGPMRLQRYQVMGVELPSDPEYVRQELANLKKQFRKK